MIKLYLLILSALAFSLLSAWLVLCLISQAFLATAVTISLDDLGHLSWLPGAWHPSSSLEMLAWATSGVIGVLSCLHMSRTSTVRLGLVGYACIALLCLGTNQYAAARVGILTGTAKIGCFDYGNVSCRADMGLSVLTTPHNALMHPLAKESVISGPYLVLLSPRYMLSGETLHQRVTKQREDLAAACKTNGKSSSLKLQDIPRN